MHKHTPDEAVKAHSCETCRGLYVDEPNACRHQNIVEAYSEDGAYAWYECKDCGEKVKTAHKHVS
jgi:hypothetical protein